MPREELKALFQAAWPEQVDGDNRSGQSDKLELNIGLDCCIKKTKIPDTFLVQTTDFFFPLVDDPYEMGKITCANVLSDMYAMGVTECDNMLMLLGVSTDMSEQERNIVVPLIMKGFGDLAREAGTTVSGGQTVKNPWMLIGGVATSVVEKSQMIPFNQAIEGDVLVLTKPLGTRIAGNAYQWYDQKMPRWEKIKDLIDIPDLVKLYLETGAQMAKLNLQAAKEMHHFGARACTDVTGFGILGHAENLASFQKNDVSFVLHTLPLINYTREIADKCGVDFKLCEGYCAETSGGLLIAMSRKNAEEYCQRLQFLNQGKNSAWIVGDVIGGGSRKASISPNVSIISVPPAC